MPQTVSLPQHMRAASVRAGSFDETDNTIEVVWTTGADVLRFDWLDGAYIERLETAPENVRLDRLNAGAAFLDTHNAYELAAMLGSVVPNSARMEDGQGLARILLSRAAGAADAVQNIRDGVINNVSVGYIVHAFTRTEASDGSPAIMVATDWEPVEISAVPVPADPGAQIRTAQRSASGLEVFPCRVTRAGDGSSKEKPVMAADKKPVPGDAGVKKTDEALKVGTGTDVLPNPVNPNDNPDMVVEKVNEPDKGKVKGQPQVVDPGDAHPLPLTEQDVQRAADQAVQRALSGERSRTNGITELATKFGMRAFADQHIAAGTGLESFRSLLIDKLAEDRAQDGGPKHTSAAPEPSLQKERNERDAGAEMARRALGKAPSSSTAH